MVTGYCSLLLFMRVITCCSLIARHDSEFVAVSQITTPLALCFMQDHIENLHGFFLKLIYCTLLLYILAVLFKIPI